MVTIYIGIDDTDILETPGTGRHAREYAARLSNAYPLLGVTRHQLLVDPRVPCTKNNSSAGILLESPEMPDLDVLFAELQDMMRQDFVPGSDPGLCVATDVPPEVTAFGRRAQRELVRQAEARRIAAHHGILLAGLGGDEGGVIGALSAVGLAASGEDGRYVMVGSLRELEGLQPVSALLSAGVAEVRAEDGTPVCEGLVQMERLRAARRDGKPIAFLRRSGDIWLPIRLD